jgi:hypothetical protein
MGRGRRRRWSRSNKILQMLLTFVDRPADSPLIERVWRSRSIAGGMFHSMAEGNLELVLTRLQGLTRVTLRGPVTQASNVACPPNGQWLAIRLSLGTYLPQLPTARLLDHQSLDLPLCSKRRFWLGGSGLGDSEFRERGSHGEPTRPKRRDCLRSSGWRGSPGRPTSADPALRPTTLPARCRHDPKPLPAD